MAVITRAAEHHILAVDFAGEKHAIRVKRQKRIFDKMESLKIIGIPHSDGRPVKAVAPGT